MSFYTASTCSIDTWLGRSPSDSQPYSYCTFSRENWRYPKRQKHGKRPLPAYYTCQIRKSAYEPQGSAGEASGRHVGRLFPVRGHFRRLPSRAVTWVRAHYRGLAHAEDSQLPKVYKLDR